MPTAPADTLTLAAQLVAHAQLVPSLTNPRKRFDPDRLKELADSMAPPIGILEPLVVRPLLDARRLAHLKGPAPFYEIVAGERRWRAAAIAQLTHVPIVIREIPDDQVIKLQLVENKNREDIHPLDEAEAMARLLAMNKAETPRTIAATIGMSERYVQNRLHYLRLVPAVKEAFREERLTAGHVDLLMRLPDADQTRAFKDGCFLNEFEFDDVERASTKVHRSASVRELDAWIKDHVRLPLEPKAPEMEFFPELATAVAAAAVKDAPRLLELVAQDWVDPKIKPAPLTLAAWTPVKKGEKCEHQQRGVIVFGAKRGTILTVCTGVKECKTHWAHTIERKAASATPGQRRPQTVIDAEKRRTAQQVKERALGQARAVALKAALAEAKKKVPNKPTPALLQLYGFKTWREMVIDRLDEETPFGAVYSGQWTDVKKTLALFGVKVAEPVLATPAAAVKAATKAVHAAAKQARTKKPRKAGAKK